jgi:hypothetical protein
MPIVTDTHLDALDLRDRSPLTIGATQRDAVRGRAAQIVRRRRLVQGATTLATLAVLAVGVTVLASSDSGPGAHRISAASPAPSPTAQVHGSLTALPAGATAHLELRGDGGTFQADADGTGSFVLANVPPGNYDAKVTVDTPSADANLGPARTVHRSPVKLVAGDNRITLPTR